MARKKRQEEHENHERWLVSYADFITLLFAFFVVMYSVSSVNEGKYRVLSDSIVAAFRDPARSLDPIQVGELMRTPVPVQDSMQREKLLIQPIDLPFKPIRRTEPESPDAGELDQASKELADSIEQAMADLVDDGLIQVRRDKRWIEVEIKTSILFPSGSAGLAPGAEPVLSRLAEKLRPLDNIIHVEGFTDNVPIRTSAFPSNWELSAARAASVVHLFTRMGVDPRRMAAIGYGEYRPVADNATPEGRARNRRVVLVIMSGADARVQAGRDHLQSLREGRFQPPDEAPPKAAVASPAPAPADGAG